MRGSKPLSVWAVLALATLTAATTTTSSSSTTSSTSRTTTTSRTTITTRTTASTRSTTLQSSATPKSSTTVSTTTTSSTTASNPNAIRPTACPTSAGGFNYLQASGSGTSADGTYLAGINYEPGYLAVFNPGPSNGFGPQYSIQAYQYDPYSQSWFDGLYYLCISYESSDPHQVGTCQLRDYSEGRTGALVCNPNFYGAQGVTCMVAGPNSTAYNTFYVDVVSGSQILAIGTAADAQAAGTKVTLTAQSANC